MARRNRRIYLAGLMFGVAFGLTGSAAATVHVVSNSECSNGNLAKSQNPPGQSDSDKRSYLAAARHSPHRDAAEDC